MNDQDLMEALRTTRRRSDAEIVRGVDRHALSALREGLTMTDRDQTNTTEAPRRGRRLGRRGATAGVLAVLLVGGGAAYAVSQLDDGPTLDGLNCAESVTVEDGDVHLDGAADGRMVSGDDVADCGQVREAAGLPALVDPYAFVYRGTHFVVSRAGVPASVLAQAQASVPSAQATAELELESAMDDWIDGPRFQCLDAARAKDYVAGTIRRVGLEGWTTRVVESPDGPDSGPCADVVPLSSARVVEIRAHASRHHDGSLPGSNPVLYRIADDLRSAIADECLSVVDAKRLATRVVGAEGEVTAVADEQARCTRVDMEVGGSVFVSVRGPSVARP
jgi:hypothetical protein